MATTTAPVIGINSLPYYLKRICTFLESDKKTIYFPHISQQVQDVLVKLTESADFLLGDEYSSNVKTEASKVAAAMKISSNKLTHEVNSEKFGFNVLMYKKTKLETFKVPEPLRKPSAIKQESVIEPPADGTIAMVFKTQCLNAATKFVKDDSQLVMRFPEMMPAQAAFLIDIIQPGTAGRSENADVGFGYRSMYAPLWESMRVFGLKYHFKIYYDTTPTTKKDMKRVIFEKIPIKKPIEIIDLDADTPEVIDLDYEDNLDDSHSSSSSAFLNESKVFERSKKKGKQSKTTKIVVRLIRKLSNQLSKGLILEKFVSDAMRTISEFLFDDQQKSIVFEAMSMYQQYFLANVAKLSRNPATYMLFNADTQKCLDNIKYCLDRKHMQYQINYAKEAIKTNKGSLRNVEFEKISPEIIDVESSEPLNSSFSTKSTTSLSTNVSETKKPKSKKMAEIENKIKMNVQKVTNQLVHNLQKGYLNEEIIENTLQRICDFMCCDGKNSITLEPIDSHHLLFIQKVLFYVREEESHRVFTNKCQSLLATINRSVKQNTPYQLRQFKGRKEVVLEKIAKRDTNSEKNSLSSTSTSVVNSASTNSSRSKDGRRMAKVQNAIGRITAKMRAGSLKGSFVEDTLQKICDFLRDEQQGSLHFQGLTAQQLLFLRHLEAIARDESWYSMFSKSCQTLLADVNRCFKGNMLYQFRKVPRRKEVFLEKPALFPTKEFDKQKENNVNVNNTNITNTEPTAPLSATERDLLIRLKATKDTVVRNRGEQTVTLYLQDISNFLTQSNTDTSITFDEVSESEAIFLKNVHVLSKLEASYPMFSRSCQKLLRSIKFNAPAHKLKFQIIVDARNQGSWTVVIEKQISGIENKHMRLLHHNSIKTLYETCRQSVIQKGLTEQVQHRARSLSAGRRANQAVANAKAEVAARGASSQRLNVKEQLKAALAQPVLPDKALRIMESMGWRGGALGLRGEGITEPIALPLDLAKRAGLGHVPKPKRTRPEPKPKRPKPAKQDGPKTSTPELPKGFEPVHALPANVIPPGICHTERKCKIVHLSGKYHVAALGSILDIVTADLDEIHYLCTKNPSNIIGFLKHAVKSFNGRYRFILDDVELRRLVAEISRAMDENRDIVLNAEIRNRTELLPRVVVIRKIRRLPQGPKKITDDIISLIDSDDEITDDQQTRVNEQETDITNKGSAKVWYAVTSDEDSESTDGKVSLIDKESTVPWYQITQTTGRQWYFPVKTRQLTLVTTKILDQKTRNSVNDTELKTTNNNTNVPELKVLSLLAVCNLAVIETDVQIKLITETVKSDEQIESVDQQKLSAQVDRTKTDEKIKTVIQPNFRQTENDPAKTQTAVQLLLLSQDDRTKINDRIQSVVQPELTTQGDQTKAEEQVNTNSQTNLMTQDETQTKTDIQTTELSKNILPQETMTPDVKITKKAKLIVKVPNMTRKQHYILTEGTETDIKNFRTTYTLEVEQHQIDKIKHTVVKVSENSLAKCATEPNRIKITNNGQQEMTTNSKAQQELTTRTKVQQDSEIVEARKSPGVMLLEKLTINNNNSTKNKNDPVAINKEKSKDAKSSVSERLRNAVNNDSSVKSQENISVNNTASIVNNIALLYDNPPLITNSGAPTRTISDTDKICNKTKDIKLGENINTKSDCTDLSQNVTETVTYFVPVDIKTTIEKVPEKIITIEENGNDNCSKKLTKTNSVSKNEPCDEDHECEVIVHDSASLTVIDSNDGEIVLISDDDDDDIKGNNNTTKQNVGNCRENVTKVTTRKVMKAKRTNQNAINNTENKSDDYYDSIDTVLTKEDPQPALMQVRKRPSLDIVKSKAKKCKVFAEYKKIYILPKNYPQTKINSEIAREIQSAILKTIDYTQETLPLLKCQGIQNGVLIYSCQDEKSLLFMEKLIQVLYDLKIVYDFNVEENLTHKMAFKISSYVDEPVCNILYRLELYNLGLFSTKWMVVKTEQCGDFTVIYVEVDNDSFNYICEANFTLYAGNDCARFTILWE